MIMNADHDFTTPGWDGKIWAYYETTSANQTITLTSSSATNTGSTMEVDGQTVSYAQTFTFAEIGMHLVKFSCYPVPTYLFYNITGPKEVYWGNGSLSVGAHCFRNCSGIRTIVIPASVTTIENRGFYLANNITVMIVKATVPPTAATSTSVSYMSGIQKIYVPYSSDHSILNAYKAKQYWSSYASKMYELNQDGTVPTS